MTVNPYFRRNKKGEQALVEALTTEAIKIHGHEMIYIPREKVTEDLIFGEEVSEFKDANRIEMYLEDADGFQGDAEMTRFGLDIKDTATFVVSRKRFMDVMGHNPEIRKIGRPREGDLIFFDYPYTMFEIKFVKHDNPFYPLGDRYSFKLVCEQFKYSNEKIDTGESEMDQIMEISSSYLVGITLSSGSGAFIVGEEVYTGTSANKKAYGAVNTFTDPIIGSSFVYINHGQGTYQVGDILVGKVSGVTYEIQGVYQTDIRVTQQEQQDNDELELEKNRDDIFDFTEKDPFSEGNY
jgi:hypothetical protein